MSPDNSNEAVLRAFKGLRTHEKLNSQDLVSVFRQNHDPFGEKSEWQDGDWNGDPLFDEEDLISAIRSGRFERQSTFNAFSVPQSNGLSASLAMITLFLKPNRAR